jgi:hypothetical protein
MGISFTRFSSAVVIAMQWFAVAFAILVTHRYEALFKDFKANSSLPAITQVTLNVTRPLLIVPVAVLSTVVVLAAELWLRTPASRIVVQAITLCVWFLFTCVCVVTIAVPLFNLITKLTH